MAMNAHITLVVQIPSSFEFDLGDDIVIASSGAPGEVIGRAEHTEGASSYHVEYERHDGVEARAWFSGNQLLAVR